MPLVVSAAPLALPAQQSVAAGRSSDVESSRAGEALLARPVTVRLDSVRVEAAVRALADQAKIRVQYRPRTLDAITTSVTLHASNVPLGVAFARVLEGTSLEAVAIREDVIVIVPASSHQVVNGVIRGTVTDVKTKTPIAGASVAIDGATRGMTTDEHGAYRFASVSAGAHTVTIKRVGYARKVQRVTVTDGEEQVVDAALEQSANQLDQVVVTGTVIPTEMKAVPNAMTVITAKEIEQRGITHVDQLFRGDVPGVFALNGGAASPLGEVTMFSRGASAIQPSSRTNYSQTNPIKTYVDGVELADPQYLSQLDPRSIERIEILTGPQASTIYGSNAINGVMQIFTKRGSTPKPQVTATLMSGLIQNSFNSALTPLHDYSAQVNGVEGRLSYNAGAGWNYVGQWAPSQQTARLNAFGGARMEMPTPVGSFTTDVSLRRTNTQNQERGDFSQGYSNYGQTGWYNVYTNASGRNMVTDAFSGQTLGLTLNYAPLTWWSHEVGVGVDVANHEGRHTQPSFSYKGDTNLFYNQTLNTKRSMHYNTTLRVPVTSVAQATLTTGVDGWQSITNGLSANPSSLSGTLHASYMSVTRQPEHNTGAFLQGQLGFFDRLFLTYGFRAEWNPSFGKEAEPNYAPRYGISYNVDVGPVTAKLRGSYGRSTRPPAVDQKRAFPETQTDLTDAYGQYNTTIANPELAPEIQQGGEGGLELYLGNRASLSITRYNQTVNDLIVNVEVPDSIRSLQPNPIFYGFLPASECVRERWGSYLCSSQDAAGYVYKLLTQNINAANIRNSGWEVRSTLTTGPFTSTGTYSWTRSRTIGVNPRYAYQFASVSAWPDFQRGATYALLPEHTWAVGTTYALRGTTITLAVNGVGRLRDRQNQFSLRNLDMRVRLDENRYNFGEYYRTYTSFSGNYAMADLTASHQFTHTVEGVMQLQNLTNEFTDDFEARFASQGRQSKAGFRVRF